MKKLMALALCLGMTLSMAACVPENREYIPSGGELVMDTPGSVGDNTAQTAAPQDLTLIYYPKRSVNPFTCNDYTNRALFSLIYQGLFSVSQNYEAVPVLCGQYEVSEDLMT